jgi:hemerythrin-like domain-containing protein
MRAIELLLAEHNMILEFLDLLQEAGKRVARDEGPAPEFFEGSVEFCRTYADKAHHYKEEHVMFGLLAQKHEGKLDDLIARHRDQHETCRNLVGAMAGSIASYGRGETEGARALSENISEYVKILRSHIESENEIFFPMSLAFISDEEGVQLLEEFERYEESAGVKVWEGGPKLLGEISAQL